jgi:hypothetical protein
MHALTMLAVGFDRRLKTSEAGPFHLLFPISAA